jgi:hypothetical protein
MAELFGFTIARKKQEDQQENLPSIVSPTQEVVLLRLRLVVLMVRMLILKAKQRTKANL